mgnify:CR=1 FL=1
MTQEVTERQCKKCGETKPIQEFYKYKNGKPISQCKSCKRTYYKANRQRHKDQMMKDQFNDYYTVYCIAFPDGMRYVGSTKRKIKYRLHHHWSSKSTVYKYVEEKGFDRDKCRIAIIQDRILDEEEARRVEARMIETGKQQGFLINCYSMKKHLDDSFK